MADENKDQPIVPQKDVASRFADVQLPQEDGEKPANLNLDATVGDDGITVDPAIKAKEEADKALQDAADEEAKKKEAEEKQAAEAAGKDPAQALDGDGKPLEAAGKKQELTPFHEHPDWKKSQEEKQELRDTVNQLKGQVDALLKSKETTTDEKKVAVKTAEERLEEDYKNGWRPASRLEEIQRNNQYIREELEAKELAKKEEDATQQSSSNDVQKEITGIIDTTMEEMKLSEDDEKKVFKQVKDWTDSGLFKINKGNIGSALKEAADRLKLKGEIGQVVKTPEEIAKDEEAKKTADEKITLEKKTKEDEEAKKKAANSRINRGSNGAGQANAPEKKPLAKLRRSLDDVVYENRDM
ncbi:MAG: hypothetical protein M3Q73_04365 [bacterium]|nr:hypothetical protein [bacterium]